MLAKIGVNRPAKLYDIQNLAVVNISIHLFDLTWKESLWSFLCCVFDVIVLCMQLLAGLYYIPTKMCAELPMIVSLVQDLKLPPSLWFFSFMKAASMRAFFTWHTGPFMGKGKIQFCALSI